MVLAWTRKSKRQWGVVGCILVAVAFICTSFESSIRMTGRQLARINFATMSLLKTSATTAPIRFQPQDACNAAMLQNNSKNNNADLLMDIHSMPLASVRKVVREWHNRTCVGITNSRECRFAELGRELLKTAIAQNQMLFSVQVGGMDGKEADPLYDMFVTQNHEMDLRHWFPVVVEPVPSNHRALQATYQTIVRDKNLTCLRLANAAISYDNNANDDQNNNNTETDDSMMGKCNFCHFDTSKDNDEHPTCRDHPAWIKVHLGTLDCEYSKTFHNVNFDECIAQSELPCGTIGHLLQKHYHLPSTTIAFLQIDIEGYEYVLLRGVIKELLLQQQRKQKLQINNPTHDVVSIGGDDDDDTALSYLPPILHFEHKVMVYQDSIRNQTNLPDLLSYLKHLGYVFFDQGEDYLALLL